MNKKKIVVLLLAILLLSVNSFAINYDFRDVNWGMSKEEVMLREKKAVNFMESKDEHKNEHTFTYTTRVTGFNCIVSYHFINNKLSYATYNSTTPLDGSRYQIFNYDHVKNLIQKKYNEKGSDKTVWLDDFYGRNRDLGYIALEKNLVYFSHIWDVGETIILLNMELLQSNPDEYISLNIQYISKSSWDNRRKEHPIYFNSGYINNEIMYDMTSTTDL